LTEDNVDHFLLIFRRETQLKCNELVTQTMEYLTTVSNLSRNTDRATKLQVERLTMEMESAVPVYGKIQKVNLFGTWSLCM